MPIEQSIWKVADKPQQLKEQVLEKEDILENMIFKDVGILNENWLLIGRQVPTDYNKYIDLLALDAAGNIIVIELKRNKTPREVVAQTIDYASWIEELDAGRIADIYFRFTEKYYGTASSLDNALQEKYGETIDEDDLNQAHQMVIVASQMDLSTERIVEYLSEKQIPINVLFFKIFSDDGNTYLSRAWMLDPSETQEITVSVGRKDPWNGEYYVSFGHDMGRNWNDALKYGFISAGGGRWYSKTLHKLNKGNRVWVNIPKTGYVGVGIVQDTVQKLDDFEVVIDGEKKSFIDAPKEADYLVNQVDDDDKAEYFVPVEWVKAVPIAQAVSEIGFFGNQNTVCQPTTPKWIHNVERLKSIWNIK